MSLHRKPGELLSRHSSLRSAWVYAPMEYSTTDDVWGYLPSVKSPWGADNRQLLTLYRSAQAGECSLVVDTTTPPSCGNSRFGCWTRTVLERDRSMEAISTAATTGWNDWSTCAIGSRALASLNRSTSFAPPTPKNIAAVMNLYPVGERFFQEFTLRQVLLNAAKNGSGPLPLALPAGRRARILPSLPGRRPTLRPR
jgi:hypothetical protein